MIQYFEKDESQLSYGLSISNIKGKNKKLTHKNEESNEFINISCNQEENQLPENYSFRVQNANQSFKSDDQSSLSGFEDESNQEELSPSRSEGNYSEKR